MVLLHSVPALRFGVISVLYLVAVEDVDSPLSPHDRNLCGREGEIEVGADVLRTHHAVSAAIRLAGDDGDLGHRGFGERKEELRAVADDPAPLLLGAGQKSRHILDDPQRNVECIAEAYEAGALDRCVDIEDPRQVSRLVGNDPDRPPPEPNETDDDVLGIVLMDFEKLVIVCCPADQLDDVVRLVRIRRHEVVKLWNLAIERIFGRHHRRTLGVVRR